MASNTQVFPVQLAGGLNVATPETLLQPGECSELTNYEITTTGQLQRMQGYERFDGQPAPSEVIAANLPGFPFPTTEDTIAAIKAAQAARRAAIQPVPGSGPVRGVFVFNGQRYAFRDNAAGDAGKMYRATATGWEEVTTPVLAPGGRYEFVETNFTGSAGDIEVIGVDGSNPAFRFNGTTFTQITGPIEPDQPIHAEVLPSQVLLLAYRGGSFVFSAVGDPTKFSPVDGGGEIAVGAEITGMQVQANATCAVFTRNRTYMLYGSSVEDFQLQVLALRAGALPFTIQSMGQSIYLDDRGLTRLDRVQQFGDFDSATISQKIQPLLQQRGNSSVCSMILRGKNQYRLFFGDTTGIALTTYGADVMGYAEFRLNFVPSCAWSGEASDGTELFYVGGQDGYVYQFEKGNSFDGDAYASSFQTGFMSFRAPENKKRWRKLVIEAQSVTRVEAQFKCYYDYADPNIPMADTLIGAGSKWDLSDWDDALWGGSSTAWTDQYIDGVSRSIGIYMRHESDYFPPHIVSQLFLHASPRGRRR